MHLDYLSQEEARLLTGGMIVLLSGAGVDFFWATILVFLHLYP